MARKPRVEFEGALYHVIVRGVIFRDRSDRMAYLNGSEFKILRSGFDPTPGYSCALSQIAFLRCYSKLHV